MGRAATQIASREFDFDFSKLPLRLQELVQRKLDAVGSSLTAFPHYRMKGSNHFRLRVGDYRVIYRFDPDRNEIYLIAIGHRREVYRD